VFIGVVVLAVLAGVGAYGLQWWTVGRFIESTDDAYVASDMVPVSSRLSGQIARVMVADNQQVHAGDVLATIDDRDLVAALDQAQADVSSTVADADGLQAQLKLQTSTIAASEADQSSADAALVLARAEFARYSDLVRTGTGSVQRQQQAEADIRAKEAAVLHARSAVDGARQQVAVLQAQLSRARAQQARAKAILHQADLNLSYAAIVAPVDGAIGDRSVRQGAYVQPGTRLLSVVPMGAGLYVVANFKETQLSRMGVGETVALDVDQLPGITLHGRVDSLAPGSGSTFALLPPENATGNFTKIVQRVPVRIRLDDAAALGQLRPGLSVTAGVDTRTAPAGPLRTLAEPIAAAQAMQK
jgi:membrane fusion protein (multidrug efflux system)